MQAITERANWTAGASAGATAPSWVRGFPDERLNFMTNSYGKKFGGTNEDWRITRLAKRADSAYEAGAGFAPANRAKYQPSSPSESIQGNKHIQGYCGFRFTDEGTVCRTT